MEKKHPKLEHTEIGVLDTKSNTLSESITLTGECAGIVLEYSNMAYEDAKSNSFVPSTVYYVYVTTKASGTDIIDKTVRQNELRLTNWRRPMASYLILDRNDCKDLKIDHEYVVTIKGEVPQDTSPVRVYLYWIEGKETGSDPVSMNESGK